MGKKYVTDFTADYEDVDIHLHYAGISTFGGYPHTRELQNVDIAIMGVPFDCGVTNRPGARLGPRGIRNMSKLACIFNYMWDMELDEICPNIIDYGDVGHYMGPRTTQYMLEKSYEHAKKILDSGAKLLTLGGDHTIPYGPVRAASEKYGKLALIHFDSHQDSIPSKGEYSHANFAYDLQAEGYIDPSKSVQACIRTDMQLCGYNIIYANEVIEMGPKTLAEKIKDTVGDMPVYLTFDMDALDPAYAPGTGTPVCGGPATNDIRTTLRNLEGINLVAADIVEVLPAYDSGEITALAAASVGKDLLCLMAASKK